MLAFEHETNQGHFGHRKRKKSEAVSPFDVKGMICKLI